MNVIDIVGISCHCWSPDLKKIAICLNNEDVIIYKNADNKDFKKWEKEHVLKGHDMIVSAIDWSPVHNKIVTCSHDRSAYVWSFEDQKWSPSMAILRINRAALDVKWSPDGSKFAVASGSKTVPVCYYEEGNDWWISKMIKKHRSTVTSVAWHPNSQLIATSSTDFRCRVFSAFIKNIDQGNSQASVFGNTEDLGFGDCIVDFDNASNGWVESCAWSPSGDCLAFTTHSSNISFVSFEDGKPVCATLKTDLPYLKVLFLSDNVCVAAGHSFKPDLYQKTDGDFKYLGSCDKNNGSAAKTDTKKSSNFSAARNIWANKTTRGKDSNEAGNDLTTLQHNSITDLKLHGESHSTKYDSFSTSGLDGRLVIWDSSDLNKVTGLSL